MGLAADGLDGAADILKFGFHYSIAGFHVYMGEMLFAMAILVFFGILNLMDVRKAGFVQTILSTLLVVWIAIGAAFYAKQRKYFSAEN